MRICVLDDAYEGSGAPFADHDAPVDPAPYLPAHCCEHNHLRKATAVREVARLARQDFDVFINLCDGAFDEDRPGREVVEALERAAVPFTGATSQFYEPSREAMKRVCHYLGIAAPPHAIVSHAREVERAAERLRFPLIVKHPSSYSSIGMTRSSRVETSDDMQVQASRMIDAFGTALVEEFVEGREFTVLVAEDPEDPDRPVTYRPVEVRFPDGESFKHFDLKWRDHQRLDTVPCDDPVLAERLREAAANLFAGLGGSGYARCDLRVDADDTPHMLEINPNCGVFYPPDEPGSADLILAHDRAGHVGFAETIVAAALGRHRRRKPVWTVRRDPDGGYGTYASEGLVPGQLIEAYEERPHRLVTREHARRCWGERRRQWFARFAYPLTDEVYVMWADDPEAWRPINHSCDPNGWLEGLDLVARQPIASGEEITIDYATFCNETMETFRCSCGTAACRGTIRGSDHLQPFVARYGEHVSDYVRRARARS